MVDHAAAVSEDLISNHFHLTISSWKKYRYDIRTHRDLKPDEVAPEAFAQILRYGRPIAPDGMREGDFYSICLQDHNILRALRREPDLRLSPLLIYILTHELIHVVRFYKFFQFFDADEAQREAEESRVHHLTYELLRPMQADGMAEIFDYYATHRNIVDPV